MLVLPRGRSCHLSLPKLYISILGLFFNYWVYCSTSTYGHVKVKCYGAGTVQRVSGNVSIQEGFRAQLIVWAGPKSWLRLKEGKILNKYEDINLQ